MKRYTVRRTFNNSTGGTQRAERISILVFIYFECPYYSTVKINLKICSQFASSTRIRSATIYAYDVPCGDLRETSDKTLKVSSYYCKYVILVQYELGQP